QWIRWPIRARGHRSPLLLEELEARRMLNAGDLDPTFATGGKILTNFSAPINATASTTVAQPDGKIVVAGLGNNGTSASDLLLARYNSDGSLDPGFGAGGKVNSEFLFNGVARIAL